MTLSELVAAALAEDLGPLGDITAALLPSKATAEAFLVPRTDGVLAGCTAAREAFLQVGVTNISWSAWDGDEVMGGTSVAMVKGRLASILTAERTALNFLCHLSGIATLTRRYGDAVAGTGARSRDTRKTTPGLRTLEKAAVRFGGGVNPRGNLSDGVLVKDNHLAGVTITEAVSESRRLWPGRMVQVECDDVDQLEQALAAGADLVLLDNMSPDEVASCVKLVAASVAERNGSRCLVEVSGGVNLDTVAAYAAAGADLIAIGALTHSAPVLDIGLDLC